MSQSECGVQGCAAPSVGFLLVHVVEHDRHDAMEPTTEFVLPVCVEHRDWQRDARFRLWGYDGRGALVRPARVERGD